MNENTFPNCECDLDLVFESNGNVCTCVVLQVDQQQNDFSPYLADLILSFWMPSPGCRQCQEYRSFCKEFQSSRGTYIYLKGQWHGAF